MKKFYFRALVLIVILVTIVSFRNSFRELAVLLNENNNRAQASCSVNSFTASPNPAGSSDQVTVSWDITSNCALPRLFVGNQDSIGLPSVSGTYNIGTITADTSLRLKSSGVLLSTVTVSLSVPPPPPPPPPSSPSNTGLLLYSTLDNLSSVTSPVSGTGAGASVSTSPTDDFTSGKTGNGIRLDSISEYVRFQQTDGSTKNVELDRGTLDFWFQPGYNHDDGQKYRIFGMGTWGTAGAWGMGKHNTSNGNDFYIHKFDLAGNLDAINTIDVSNYGWNANDWVNVRVTWDWKASPGVQNVHVYFNGVEAQLQGDNGLPVTTGTWDTVAESSNAYIYVGNVSGSGASGMQNNAVFDEVKIWDTVIPPTSSSPTPNPTPTPTPAPTVSLSASPSSISSGGSSNLTWSSTNATSCTASGDWSGTKSSSGTQSVSPTSNATYTLTCTGGGGSVNKSATVNVVSPGGSVTLPNLPQTFSVPMPNQTGKVWSIPAGDSNAFKTALNQSQLGDTIELQAGSTYVGSFVLPSKSGSGWIVIRSSAYNNLPKQGIRVSPADAVNMPKLISPGTAQETLSFASGANHYRLIGLEVTLPSSATFYNLIDISSTGSLATMPNNITFDRMYIHGNPVNNFQRCLHADGAYIAVIDSYLSECHGKGADSQAIGIWGGSGPFKFVNNRLEGAGENIIFGGADPAINGVIPSDAEIVGNYIYTPPSWGAGISPTPWTKKNLFETKNARRILLEGNIFDGSWGDGQVGNSLVLKSSNQGGRCTWCQATDLTVRYNIIRNSGAGAVVSGNSGSNNNPIGGVTSRVLIEHNIFENINVAPYTGVARILELYNNPRDVVFRNNTINTTGYIQHFITGGSQNPTVTNFEHVDNISPFGQYGIVPGFSEATLANAVAGIYNYSGSVVYGNSNTSNRSKYPNTQFVLDISAARATGKGANEAAVLSATRYAESGGGTGAPPPPTTNPSLSLIANPTSVISGSASILSWTASNLSTCTASGGWTGSKALTGTQSVSPTATTTYTLACTGSNGTLTRSATVGITTPPPTGAPGLTLTLNPTSVQSGLSALLTWLGTNVNTCTASDGWSGTRPTSGSLTVSPTVSTTYTLLCSGGTGQTVTRSATLSITPPPPTPKPVVTLSASPANINLGQSTSLIWTSTNTTSCTASGGWEGTKTTSGIQVVSPQGNATYTIDCTGNGGSTSQSVTVSVTSTGPLPTVSLSAKPSSVKIGSSATLSWTSTNALSCVASGDWTGSKSASGNYSVSPSSSATYTLTCTNPTGDASASANITVTTPVRTPPNGGGGGGGGGTPICSQVITWAKSPLTGDVKRFSTPCDVPEGWIIINPASAPVTIPGTGPIKIQPIDRPLYVGVKHSQVVGLQDFLKAKGFFPITEESSGYFGPLTMKAVQDYQRSKGIEPLGNVGPQTRAAITADVQGGIALPETVSTVPSTPLTGSFTRSLYRGLTGEDVAYLQLLLKNLGYFPLAEPTTTYFGPLTEKAVKEFQAANGIVSSGNPSSTGYGLAGVKTRARILELSQ